MVFGPQRALGRAFQPRISRRWGRKQAQITPHTATNGAGSRGLPDLQRARNGCVGPRRRRSADLERTEQVARRQTFRALGAARLVASPLPQSEAAVAQ